MTTLGTISRLSTREEPAALPPYPGTEAPGVVSNYLRHDTSNLHLDPETGVVGDKVIAPSHGSRDRDVLFVDETLIGRLCSEARPTIGQNVTLSNTDVTTWCVGDEILVGACAIVRITSCRKPCPKNNNVHGPGTREAMNANGWGGVFGRVVRGGQVQVGDSVCLLSRPNPEWTCSKVHILLFGNDRSENLSELRTIADLPYLEIPRYKTAALEQIAKLERLKSTHAEQRYSWLSCAFHRLLLLFLVVRVVMFLRSMMTSGKKKRAEL